jgi:oligopeptide/dipeptide ABC transporter ATP-binding protein
MRTERGIEVDGLKVGFPTADGGWCDVVNGVSLVVGAGERVGLVGESGSGKTLTAFACLGLVPEPGRQTGGLVKIAGSDVAGMSEAGLQRLRGSEIGLILQEAAEALNPVYTIGFQLAETIIVHRGINKAEADQLALDLLRETTLENPTEVASSYPHELSGGQAQRAMLALSLAGNPRILIADEPTSALDTLTQAQVIDLLTDLVVEREMGLLFISHDLVVVEKVVDRVAVLFAGRIVEEGATDEVFSDPRHPYTQELLASRPGQRRKARANTIRLPAADHSAGRSGCSYASRCDLVREACWEEDPELCSLGEGRRVRCPVVLRGNDRSSADE